jgi:glycosyltransferase XagB
VTEDADLGLRLAVAGFEIADLPSVTLEEAPFRFSAWFAQRRRWHKGFVQTLVSHGQTFHRDIRRIGWFNWTGGVIQIAGTIVGALLFPIFTFYVVWSASTGALFENRTWLAAAQNTAALWVAVCGAMTAFVPALIGMRRRRIWHIAPWLLTLPVYLILVSAAAWVAVVDYWRAPFVWNKTEHGLGTRRPEVFRSRREVHS